jgi:predicted nucleic acid-binding protein
MRTVFVDTSYLIALWHQRDPLHEAAQAWHTHLVSQRVNYVITELVVIEYANAIAATRARSDFLTVLTLFRTHPHYRLLPATTSAMNEAVSLYDQTPGVRWSLTDCLSFVEMKANGITEALTHDRHFNRRVS